MLYRNGDQGIEWLLNLLNYPAGKGWDWNLNLSNSAKESHVTGHENSSLRPDTAHCPLRVVTAPVRGWGGEQAGWGRVRSKL